MKLVVVPFILGLCSLLLATGCIKKFAAHEPSSVESHNELLESYRRARLGDVKKDLRSSRAALGISVGKDLTKRNLDESKETDIPVVLVIGSERCGASVWFMSQFEATVREFGLEDHVLVTHAGSTYYEVARSVAGRAITFPAVLLVRQGELEDLQMGVEAREEYNRIALKNLFVRNGLINGEQVYIYEFSEMGERSVFNFVRRRRGLQSADLSGQNLSGIRLSRGSFSGSSLRDADLSNAFLQNIVLSHVDLTGANVEGADFTNAFLRHSICPDGTLSELNGGICIFE